MVDWMGWTVLGFVLIISGWLSWMTVTFPRTGSLMDGMIRTTFVPSKRRRYIQVLSVEGSAILLSALTWALGRVGVVPDSFGVLAVGALLLIAVGSVASLTFLGLQRTPLSREELTEIGREVPELLHSLALVPIEQREPTGGE